MLVRGFYLIWFLYLEAIPSIVLFSRFARGLFLYSCTQRLMAEWGWEGKEKRERKKRREQTRTTCRCLGLYSDISNGKKSRGTSFSKKESSAVSGKNERVHLSKRGKQQSAWRSSTRYAVVYA